MKKLLLLLILLLINSVMAATIQHGKVTITVINRPPRIISLTILPEEPYYDSVLECNAEIDDESPETITYEYVWYKNDLIQEEKSGKFSDINDNDNVKCFATPIDEHSEKGNTESAETIILASPARVKLIKPVLNLIGVQVPAKELAAGTSMEAVTGMVTGTRATSGITLIFMLGIFLLILIGINLFGLSIKLRRTKSPTQD